MASVPKKRIARLKNVNSKRLTLGRSRGVLGIRSSIDDLLFKGEKFRSNVTDAVLDAEVRRTIQGASTISLTLADDKNELVTRPIFRNQFDLEVDDLWFRLQGIEDTGDGLLSLGFEARDVNRLRHRTGHLKVLRKQLTRAEFILLMIRELRHPAVSFFSPQVHVVQPVRSKRDHRRQKADRDEQRRPGFGPGANITVKGVRANPSQVRIAEVILDTCLSLNCNFRVMSMAIACATQESNMVDLQHGDYAHSDSHGPFGQWDVAYPNNRDLVGATKGFLLGTPSGDHFGIIEYEKNHPSANFSLSIAAVQRCREDLVMEYQRWKEEANNTVKEYLGGTTGTTTYELEKKIPYAFERKKDENSWKAMTRLAGEVRWRVFESNGLVYYVSDEYLLKSRVRALVTPDSPGVDKITAKYHGNKEVEEATITGRAKEWAAPPGTVVRISGKGKADGRWLVHEITSSLFSEDFEASLRRPVEPLPEPPPETKTITRTVSTGSAGGSSGGTSGELSQVRIRHRTTGDPWWGGSYEVFKQFIIPFMKHRGLGISSTKRPENSGSGLSDHYVGSTSAYAVDFPTSSGEDDARALAEAMNAPYSPGQWNKGTIRVDGLTFECQILWAAPDGTHYDHVHVGLHRA